ncbi:Cro/CI family transcriptional regulator [Proteus vulgaris]|uniref:Cro/CI family transcriptional regulator n=1 Tax=Proteus vulgaris TaxID=585 RepID=UPI003C7D6F29
MKKKDVITFFGGTCKTAKALGIKHPSVCGWGYIIPKVRAYLSKSRKSFCICNWVLGFTESVIR